MCTYYTNFPAPKLLKSRLSPPLPKFYFQLMKTVKLYLKKNGYKKPNDRLPDFNADLVLDQEIRFLAGEPISVAVWLDHNHQKLTIHIKPSELDLRKTENKPF